MNELIKIYKELIKNCKFSIKPKLIKVNMTCPVCKGDVYYFYNPDFHKTSDEIYLYCYNSYDHKIKIKREKLKELLKKE